MFRPKSREYLIDIKIIGAERRQRPLARCRNHPNAAASRKVMHGTDRLAPR
jgi:hypothetical protein